MFFSINNKVFSCATLIEDTPFNNMECLIHMFICLDVIIKPGVQQLQAWFFKIIFVQTLVRLCVYAPKAINNYSYGIKPK